MSSSIRKNDAFENFLEENEEDEELNLNNFNTTRPSLIARQISFSQRKATLSEIILVILPYFILLIDIFIFFILRGFKSISFDGSISPDSNTNN